MENNQINQITLKSPTGSGKTLILTQFMHEYHQSENDNVFIWFTAGTGNLEEQSKSKMDRYIHGSRTKTLYDVLARGFEGGDSVFLNWELINNLNRVALRDGEMPNLFKRIEEANKKKLNFNIVIDESHFGDTSNNHRIVGYFNPRKIIRASATPNEKNGYLITIGESEVIESGLIKKAVAINYDLESNEIISVQQEKFLIEQALIKREQLVQEFRAAGSVVNPLIVVQLPNNRDDILFEVEDFLNSKGINVENEKLAIWLNDRNENTEDVELFNAKPEVILIKQAIALGWDCPRAHILVKLREDGSPTFQIQTLGRIRRMPEAKHYNNDLLDTCYLYTLDKEFVNQVKAHMGSQTFDAKTLTLKPEYKDLTFPAEIGFNDSKPRDPRKARESIRSYFMDKYDLEGRTSWNKKTLEDAGYVFLDHISVDTLQGQSDSIDHLDSEMFDEIHFMISLGTHEMGQDFRHILSQIGRLVSMRYSMIVKIIRFLFEGADNYKTPILRLSKKDLYRFVINNQKKLAEDIQEALSRDTSSEQEAETIEILVDKDFSLAEKVVSFPKKLLFTYQGDGAPYARNVYEGYTSNAEPRSNPEKRFERYLNNVLKADWWYKNGDKGAEYLSIRYKDNADKNKLFYPDYIVSINGKTWIFEIKGDFGPSGVSEDIDSFTAKKAHALTMFNGIHKLQGGIVRFNEANRRFYISQGKYSDNINDDNWIPLKEFIEQSQ